MRERLRESGTVGERGAARAEQRAAGAERYGARQGEALPREAASETRRTEAEPVVAATTPGIVRALVGVAFELARSPRMRPPRIGVVIVTTCMVASAQAANDSPMVAREPFPVVTSALDRGATLVVSPIPDAASLAVCAAPVPIDLDAAWQLELAKRGGEPSRASVDGVATWCFSLPPSELRFGLWSSARVRQSTRAASVSGSRGDFSFDPSLARAAALALEGANGTPLVDGDGTTAASSPSRFTVVVTGAVDVAEAETLSVEYFGAAADEPRSARPEPWRPQQTTERMAAMQGDVASPRARYTWLTPEGSRDETGIRIALEVLGGGVRARLPRLFADTHLGKRAEAWAVHLPGGMLSGLVVEPSTRVSIDRLRRFVDGALKQMRLVGPSRRELVRARSRLLLDAYRTWEDPLALGRLLASYELSRGGAARAPGDVTALERVTTLDVIRAVLAGLTDARRTTVEIYPPAWPADDPRVAKQKLYTVADGDTLAAIALRFRVTVAALARANDVDPKYALSPGQPLWIPPP